MTILARLAQLNRDLRKLKMMQENEYLSLYYCGDAKYVHIDFVGNDKEQRKIKNIQHALEDEFKGIKIEPVTTGLWRVYYYEG